MQLNRKYQFTARERLILHPSSTAIVTRLVDPKNSCPVQICSGLCYEIKKRLHGFWSHSIQRRKLGQVILIYLFSIK